MKYLTHTILIAMIVVAAIFNSYFVNDVAANPDPLFETGQQVGTLLRSDVIEASGLASSRRNTGVLYTHDDSGGDNVFFAINTEGTLLGTYTLATGSMSDAEDIAVGPGPTPDVNYVFVGDIGDNGNSRPYITVKRVAEPEISSDQGHESVTLSGVDLIKLQYPSGGDAPSHKDTETLMIDTNGDLRLESI